MPDPVIENPLSGQQAFEQDDERAGWSQAAQVVGLGLQLAGRADVLWEAEGAADLSIPEVPPLEIPFPAEWAEFYIQDHLNVHLPFRWRNFPGWSQPIESYISAMTTAPRQWWQEFEGLERRLAPPLYQAIRTGEDPRAAAASLLHVSQFSHHQIVRAAAAASLANLRTTLSWPTIEALAEGCSSPDETIQQIAIDALLRVAPEHPALNELRNSQEPEEESGTDQAHTSITVPGTWTRSKRPGWWRPGERLFAYLQVEPGNTEPSDGTFTPVGQDLYAKDNYYRWPSKLTVHDRSAAAIELADWALRHGCATGFSKVFAHSHGGNVALLAAARHGIKIDLLVMIATPPHERSELEWAKISENVKRIVSLRPRFDIVVLLDRGWSSVRDIPVTGAFPEDRVRSIPVPVWFDHSALTRPEVWRKHRLSHEVAYEYEITQAPPTW